MKDGIVQQVDSPSKLYAEPANKFVAGFIGSPQMNFLEGAVVQEGGDLKFQIEDYNLTIPGSKAKVLKDKGYVGRKVCLGIRPEDIYDSEMFIESSPGSVMDSTIKVYELLGAEVYLYFDLGSTQITARVDPRTTARAGDPIKFALDMEKVHFFDIDTEVTIVN